jgi:hypothetical protein
MLGSDGWENHVFGVQSTADPAVFVFYAPQLAAVTANPLRVQVSPWVLSPLGLSSESAGGPRVSSSLDGRRIYGEYTRPVPVTSITSGIAFA